MKGLTVRPIGRPSNTCARRRLACLRPLSAGILPLETASEALSARVYSNPRQLISTTITAGRSILVRKESWISPLSSSDCLRSPIFEPLGLQVTSATPGLSAATIGCASSYKASPGSELLGVSSPYDGSRRPITYAEVARSYVHWLLGPTLNLRSTSTGSTGHPFIADLATSDSASRSVAGRSGTGRKCV
jgi:hypothetical protein